MSAQVGKPKATCPGYCCAAFHWPATITEMRARDQAGYMDGAQIRDMLIPLSPKQAKERYERFSGRKVPRGVFAWNNRGHHFTCKNWDEESRLCKVYETRPQMCKGYPYGNVCEHGCGFKGGTPIGELADADAT